MTPKTAAIRPHASGSRALCVLVDPDHLVVDHREHEPLLAVVGAGHHVHVVLALGVGRRAEVAARGAVPGPAGERVDDAFLADVKLARDVRADERGVARAERPSELVDPRRRRLMARERGRACRGGGRAYGSREQRVRLAVREGAGPERDDDRREQPPDGAGRPRRLRTDCRNRSVLPGKGRRSQFPDHRGRRTRSARHGAAERPAAQTGRHGHDRAHAPRCVRTIRFAPSSSRCAMSCR